MTPVVAGEIPPDAKEITNPYSTTRPMTLETAATAIVPRAITANETITIGLPPYRSASQPNIGCENPEASVPTKPTKEIAAVVTPQSSSHVDMKIPKPCRAPIEINVTKNKAAIMYQP